MPSTGLRRGRVLLLTTTGRRTGRLHTTQVFYLEDGERLFICNVTPEFEHASPWVLNSDRRLGTYSGGMKQRVGIAQAILNHPELLIVDEPTAGLDPAERVHFRSLLASLTVNRLVLLSTHIISDVEAVADRLVLLADGCVVADVGPRELIASAHGHVWTVETSAQDALRLQQRYPISALVARNGVTTLRVLSSQPPSGDAAPVEPSLEDAYLVTMASLAPETTGRRPGA